MDYRERNCTIDIFRYVCAIMVVMIHVCPLEEFSGNLGFITSNIIPRIAVPFFFIVSGYYYIQKLENNEKIFTKYICGLIKIYLIWSVVYFTVNFVEWGYKDIIGFIMDSFLKLFVLGSYYHLWFFPAMIVTVCIATVAFKVGAKRLLIPLSIVFYIIGCLGTSYYSIGAGLPVLGQLFNMEQFLIVRRIFLMGFPFFCCGYLIFKVEDKLKKLISNRTMIVVLGFAVIVWLLEIWMVIKCGFQINIVITPGLYLLVVVVMLTLLRYPCSKLRNLSRQCYVMANFTYYAHPLFILIFTLVLPKLSSWNTLLFLLTVLSTGIVGMLIYVSNNKMLKQLVK